ncbi:hypothetical protein EBN88_14155 [Streptomyces triticirhizae]|uniref:Integral membrane protein n=2 Tax=Streptomyces triticirhizae TaxID=2483353 RepID=A0A3M2LS53_9ACTN|nr:hypothetical protein EBN88_14155 [Streptomyces triticirhizae]
MMRAVDDAADDCDMIEGPARDFCTGDSGGDGEEGGAGVGDDLTGSLDPLTSLAREVGRAADWMAGQLGQAVDDRSAVDFTNAGFLQQYAVVFAASSVLVLILWLLAVTKRAVRGVPLLAAMGEAIGLLWLAVSVTAFAPLILYVVVSATGGVTDALVVGLGDSDDLFTQLGGALADGQLGGGPLMLLITSAATILLCGALWCLLVLRALALYVGAVLGIVVYAGLVDRDLWGHVRRWAGFMVGVILVEPVMVIVLGLAAALQTSDDQSPVVAGLAVTVIALGATIYMITKFPGLGDAVRAGRASARAVGATTRVITGGGSSATAGVRGGISAHGQRGSSTSSSPPSGGGSVQGGISAHGQRAPKPKPKD